MTWLNYHHLYYFWVVAKEGSIQRACEQLRLAQPTISGQLHALEQALGEKLFTRVGRHLVPTDTGRLTYRYANRIFSLGQELTETLKGRDPGRPIRFVVGLADVIPKSVACWLLRSALSLPRLVHMICHEGRLDHLLADLALHNLDLVLADCPVPPTIKVQAYSHLLGESGVTLFATRRLVRTYHRNFPRSLDGAPFLLPTLAAGLRRSLDDWLTDQGIRPFVHGEFDDMATLFAFGQTGDGIFPASTVMEKEIISQYRVQVVGRIKSVKVRFYAITVARRLQHPAVVAISESAQKKLKR